MDNEDISPEHAVVILQLEETQGLLVAQAEKTARYRVAGMQLEQQNKVLKAELASLRAEPEDAPDEKGAPDA